MRRFLGFRVMVRLGGGDRMTVRRGPNGVEVIMTLFCWKVLFPGMDRPVHPCGALQSFPPVSRLVRLQSLCG